MKNWNDAFKTRAGWALNNALYHLKDDWEYGLNRVGEGGILGAVIVTAFSPLDFLSEYWNAFWSMHYIKEDKGYVFVDGCVEDPACWDHEKYWKREKVLKKRKERERKKIFNTALEKYRIGKAAKNMHKL